MSDGEESPGSGSDAAMRKVKSAPRLQRGVLRLWGPRTEGHVHNKETIHLFDFNSASV
jgi:hypothetical protein